MRQIGSACACVVLAAGMVAGCTGGNPLQVAEGAQAAPAVSSDKSATGAQPQISGAIRLTGTVEAVRSRTVAVPRLSGTVTPMIITRLAKPGTRVQAGDVIVEFDPQEQQRLAFDKRAELVDLDGQILKKKAEQIAAEAKDQTEVTAAENDVARAKLEVRKNELIARVSAEKNSLALEQATAKLEQLRTTFKLKRQAAAADLRILEIRRERAERALAYAEKNAQLMQISAPFAGLVVVKTMYRSAAGYVEIIEGDEVRPGVPVIDIVDTSAMLVRARVNQADAELVRVGQAAAIRLDGFPDLSFTGRVEHITPLAVGGYYSSTMRAFTALVSITESHPQLLPDLTASVEIASTPATPVAPAARRP
jgi:multidrug resistance efflux pump